MSSWTERSSSRDGATLDDIGAKATDLRSAATIVGGVGLVLLLAPRPAWVALVIVVSVIVGAINYRRMLRRRFADLAASVRTRRVGFSGLLDLLDGLEVVVVGVIGTGVFVGLNLVIWHWVERQGFLGLVFLYLVLLGFVILSLIRDLAFLRFGPVTGILGAIWLCCALWAAFQLW